MTKPITITRRTWDRLKAGDVLIFASGPRTVQVGPADRADRSSRCSMLRLSKIRNTSRKMPSFRSPSTIYLYHDVCRKCRKASTGRIDRRSVCEAEQDALRTLGFDPVRSLQYEINRTEDVNRRMGTMNFPRAMRVAKMKLRRLKRKASR